MVHCLFLGPFKDDRLKSLAEDYLRRLSRLWPVDLEEIPEDDRSILRHLKKRKGRGEIVSLDADGKSMDSGEFMRWVTSTPKDLTLVGWGASGPKEEWKALADRSLSLSPMTASHELARVFLLEQLYRAAATLKGHPYAK